MTTQSLSSDVTANEILAERVGAVLSIQLNRPTKKNAMTSSMYVWMADLLDSAARDETIRVVLWHSAGDSFSAGNDLGDFLSHPPQAGKSPQGRLFDSFVALEKPVVAAVRGVAIGGGTTLLAHCDFVYASETARFQLPFVDFGLVPEFGSSYLLPLRMGHARAAELFFLGEPFDAARAAQLGLVTKVVPEAQLLSTARETATKLAQKPAQSLQACKRLLKHSFREPAQEMARLEVEEFAARVVSPEAKEIFAAFLAKHEKAHRS